MRSTFFGLMIGWLSVTTARGAVVLAHDSVEWPPDAGGAAAEVLAEMRWEAGEFEVRVEETPGRDYDARVTFASPRPSGDAGLDTVVLRWYRPPPPPEADETKGAGGSEDTLPGALPGAVLLVHTLHPDLPVAKALARGLRQRETHAFVIELPGYASRVGQERRMTGVTTLLRGAQAVTDCRRAYDAIRALAQSEALAGAGGLPIDGGHVAIQGTSLGSFIATAAAALDGCFDQTFLFLAGGDGVDILETGQKDAFHVRGALRHYGYADEKLRELIEPIEPLRLAHRLDPETTWMFNARDDLVVPARNATLLAEAIGLDETHHLWLPGNHYTAFILLPGVLDRMRQELDNHREPKEVDAAAETETVSD